MLAAMRSARHDPGPCLVALLAVAVAAAASSFRRQTAAKSSAGLPRIDELVARRHRRQARPRRGRAGRPRRPDSCIEKAYGHRATVPADEPMTLDTIFDLASLTKVVATTTAVMPLVEQGRIRLNDPVATHMPGFERYGKGGITSAIC